MTGAWRPLLTGAERDAALAVAGEISAGLTAEVEETAGPSLSGGAAGFAIAEAYLELAVPDCGHADRAAGFAERAFDAIPSVRKRASLYRGFAGVAWAVEHVSRILFDLEDDGDPLVEVDQLIERLLATPGGLSPEYDLIGGTVGLGVYALERAPRPLALQLTGSIVDWLDRASEPVDGGRRWKHAVALIPEPRRARYPDGWYNLGLAHGVPGVIALCAELARADLLPASGRAMVEQAVGWLLAQARPPGVGGVGRFPAHVAPGIDAEPVRPAWCYGDAGVAMALLAAGRAFARQDWIGIACDLLSAVARASERELEITDAMLCHGAAGMAHLLNRAAQATGERALEEGARAWFGRVLAMGRPAEPGLLEGATGIALALVAAASDVEPQWDRAMLINVPPAAHSAMK